MTPASRTPAPGSRPGSRVPVIVRATAPASARTPATPQRNPQAPARGPERSPLAEFAAQHGLDADGVLALAKQVGTRRLAERTQAETAVAASAVYDACFGPGAYTADARP